MDFLTLLEIIASIGLVIMAGAIFAAVHLVRKERNATTTLLKYSSVIFGIFLVLDCMFFLPLYLMTGFGIAWAYSGQGLTYFLLWIFFGYPIFYIFGQIGAHIAYRKAKLTLCKILILLPLLSLIPLILSWILIAIHGFKFNG